LISYTSLSASCSSAPVARARVESATAGVLTGVTRDLNGQGGAHTAGTPVTPTAAPSAYLGDCDATGAVTVNEIITLVAIALGTQHVSKCPSGLPATATDADVTVPVIIQAVNNALNGLQR